MDYAMDGWIYVRITCEGGKRKIGYGHSLWKHQYLLLQSPSGRIELSSTDYLRAGKEGSLSSVDGYRMIKRENNTMYLRYAIFIVYF